MKLELSDVERLGLEQNYALSLDPRGNEVFVGLTREESLFFLEYRRASSLTNRAKGLRPPREDRERARELRDRHEIARLQVVGGMAEKENSMPTTH